jgi:hypothetical protein
MILVVNSSISTSAALVVASFLMIVVGVSKKRLGWRSVECRVCHRPRGCCTCRWL